MQLLFYLLYNLLVTLVFPVLWAIALFNKKFRGNLAGQRELKLNLSRFRAKVDADPKPVLWLHAASAGEFEQINPLLDRFRNEDIYIFQTFTSSTIYYKTFTDKRFDGVGYLPWDLIWRVNRFIKELQPDLHINTRHDLWPNLLAALRRKGIRSVLVNANLYSNSLRLRILMKQINSIIFNQLSAVYTVSENVAGLLKQIYRGDPVVSGDTRFDRVNERADQNTGNLIPLEIIKGRSVVIYGSVIESDLKILGTALGQSKNMQNMLHIIVPHEVRERDLIPWEVECFRHKLKTIRHSELESYQDEKIIIWNTVGQLADLYKQASLAYVGAGFSTGVHSVTEPAIYRIPAAHGPRYEILAEAIELVEMGISRVVNNGEELAQWLRILDDPEALENKRQALDTYIIKGLGASDRIVASEIGHLLQAAG